jgi:multicomponent Na+:H+ antiporter subunit D
MINYFPPAVIFILGSFLVPFLKGHVKSAYMLLLPVFVFISLLNLSEGTYWVVSFLEYELILGKVDKLSLAFGYIFTIISFIATLYAIRVKDDGQHVSAFLYASGALGVVFAGDLISLFVFWEVMAVTAAYLVWAGRTKAASAAGLRYLIVHIFGGFLLLIGIIINVANTGSIEFGYIGLDNLASWLIFLGFGINCAFPILHAWLPDAYPEATFSGTIFLSAFTTKTTVYVLARSFPGTELLIWIGALMTVFPIFYAVIENNLRRVLSYSLINQVGFMVIGVGIGTSLSLNGTVAHAFAHILYKALLFMSMGAVLHQTGKINATDLGGLYKTMPITTVLCIIGAATSAGFPLTSGFVTKSMIVSASGHEGLTIIWLTLMFASAGVVFHSGVKVPFFAFFAADSGIRTKEPPLNMLIAMGIAAFLCIFIGVFPSTLYSILPYPVDYKPYTGAHVIDMLQLLFFSALAFTLLMRSGLYPAEMRCTNLDADWFYRKGAKAFMWFISNPMSWLSTKVNKVVYDIIPNSLIWAVKNPSAVIRIASDTLLLQFSGSDKSAEIEKRLKKEKDIYPGNINIYRPVGLTVLLITLFLLVYLLVYYLQSG